MIVTNELLGYPRIKILQDNEMFHFSIDSMLLAHFATINNKTKTIVDFCSGNAPIPLYLTLRTDSKITGIEIQSEAAKLAQDSVNLNNLEQQITIINDDVKNVFNHFKQHSVNLITCNPPYFKLKENSNLNKNDYLSYARHEILIDLETIISISSKLLTEGGYLAMVYTPLRLQELMSTLMKYNFNVSRLQFIYPKRGREANHVLVEARLGKNKEQNVKILQPLFVYQQNDKWTKDILKIYNFGLSK